MRIKIEKQITADQLLERMLKFAASPECPEDRKVQVFNNAYKCWADSLTENNPFAYEKVKHEKIQYIEGFPIVNKLKTYGVYKKKKMTAAEWIQRRKDNNYRMKLKKEAILYLQNPERYKGYSKHPAEDKTIRQVKEATISPCKHSNTGWVELHIYFSDGERYFDSSASVRGAKLQFAFLINKNSKWLPKTFDLKYN